MQLAQVGSKRVVTILSPAHIQTNSVDTGYLCLNIRGLQIKDKPVECTIKMTYNRHVARPVNVKRRTYPMCVCWGSAMYWGSPMHWRFLMYRGSFMCWGSCMYRGSLMCRGSCMYRGSWMSCRNCPFYFFTC